MQPEMRRYRDWLQREARGLTRLLVLDLHTGLGRHGGMQLFSEVDQSTTRQGELIEAFGRWLVSPNGSVSGYAIRGGVGDLIRGTCPAVDLDYRTVEFGTRPLLRVLKALRDENRAHFHAAERAARHRYRLKRALCPDSSAWRRAVVDQGLALVERAVEYLAPQ